MVDRIVNEWRSRGLGVLVIGGCALVENGIPKVTSDLDCCVCAPQCPRMLEWLFEKERGGQAIRLVPGCAPLHADWLANGWFCHVLAGDNEFDFFGVPMRAPPSVAERFWSDSTDLGVASLHELGLLKRTGRLKDWADIDLIANRLWESGAIEATLEHSFGDVLFAALQKIRSQPGLLHRLQDTLKVDTRPILRLGLTAPLDQLHEMTSAERSFWIAAGANRRAEIKRVGAEFWADWKATIESAGSFEEAHSRLFSAAVEHLPRNPIKNPAVILDGARAATKVERWPGLVPPTAELIPFYFPAYRGAELADVPSARSGG